MTGLTTDTCQPFSVQSVAPAGTEAVRVGRLCTDDETVSRFCEVTYDGTTLTRSATVIPVELISFTAVASDPERVRLAWETATEENNDRFEVERRIGGAVEAASPNGAWSSVAEVAPGAPGGNSSEPLRYTFADAKLPFEATALTYRLVQYDADGTREVAGEATVGLDGARSFVLQGHFPNPVRDRTTIRYAVPEAARVTVALYDARGRKVRTLVSGKTQSGRQVLTVEAGGLPSGMYFCRVTARERTAMRRLALVR